MNDLLHPALIYLLGAVLIPFLPNGKVRATILLLVPIAAALPLLLLPYGTYGEVALLGETLTLFRLDRLSFVFTLIFSLAAFLSLIYAWHVRDTMQQVAALAYAGSAIGAALAGDLITLFIWWEGTAIASVFLIWARRTPGAYHTGMRYLIVQIASGVILLGGAAIHYRETGSLAFDALSLDRIGAWLILLSFGIKCAFPLLHNWLQDSYPAATVTGTVILSAFTTKLAIYALARGYAGTEFLIYIGATMTLFPIFYAVIENDLRRVLAYSLNNQLGFMVVGIGIGSELAINGTAAHAFSHILYKALLFMSVGAVLFRTGTAKGSELGGLYKTMPLTMVFCTVGAASISAFPLFSGFISKSMILSAAGHDGYYITWLILLFASAGVFHHSGIKIPYFAFFAHDSGKRPAEAPWNMLLAMGLTSALCIGIGVYPNALYNILPFPVDYNPYTSSHVITQLQLLWFSALAFGTLMRTGIYPPELRSTNLDSDWMTRRFAPAIIGFVTRVFAVLWEEALRGANAALNASLTALHALYGPTSRIARIQATGHMVLWLALLLTAALFISLLDIS
ncbi:Na(+)/H(+) antiporter subunit D [Pseudahrensia aquimaris]|uniref:Na(+)/H(+) antiporter subunit D n=1 Tax=Pseudahrensia aquimaris TaxID=744461 RepID=A0ABW3FHQ1_9HYPH